MTQPTLNERAQRLADYMATKAAALRVAVHTTAAARVIDCGIKAPGGLQAGLGLARVCLAGLAEVTPGPRRRRRRRLSARQVSTDHPVAACMASQYAGWQVSVGKFFAMGSGPMRAAYGKEELFEHIPGREKPPRGRRRAGDAQAARRRRRSTTWRRRWACRRASSRCWSRRRPASPATCRSWPARSRRPCTSCTS